MKTEHWILLVRWILRSLGIFAALAALCTLAGLMIAAFGLPALYSEEMLAQARERGVELPWFIKSARQSAEYALPFLGVPLEMAVSSVLFFGLARFLGDLFKDRRLSPTLRTVFQLRRIAQILLVIGVIGYGNWVVKTSQAKRFAQDIKRMETLSPKSAQQNPARSVAWMEVEHIFLPNFQGSSALLLSLLAFLIARLLKEKLELQNQVGLLREDTNLTI